MVVKKAECGHTGGLGHCRIGFAMAARSAAPDAAGSAAPKNASVPVCSKNRHAASWPLKWPSGRMTTEITKYGNLGPPLGPPPPWAPPLGPSFGFATVHPFRSPLASFKILQNPSEILQKSFRNPSESFRNHSESFRNLAKSSRIRASSLRIL